MTTADPTSDAAYTVRLFQPEDAAGVSALVRAVYGDTYTPHPEAYHPDEILRQNQAGELVSVVAFDPAGRLVGHYALERPDGGRVAEAGEAMVLPEHRRHGLMERMRGLLEQAGHRLGLDGVYGRAVTNHVFSQRSDEHFGCRPCGISLGWSPRSLRNLAEALPQRMSEVLYFKYLRGPSPAAVHAPEQHQDLLGRIYAQFGVAVTWGAPLPPHGPGEVAVAYRPLVQRGELRVRRVGADTAAEILRHRQEMCERLAAEVVMVELPLGQPGTPAVCAALEAEGFFVNGIGPCFAPDGDVLRLLYLAVELDVRLLQIFNPFAQELATYFDRERARVGRPQPVARAEA